MDRIELAMSVIRRVDFLPEDQRAFVGQDRPLSIGLGQTNSQPRTVAAMLELLDVAEGHRVLDVGAGSGWTTALLGQLVGPRGSVVGVELEPALAAWGAGNVARYGMDWVRLYPALAALGRPAQSPYDRILVSAAAQEVPQELVDQLVPGGKMVIPVQGVMHVVSADGQGGWTSTRHGSYRFVQLRRVPLAEGPATRETRVSETKPPEQA
jgi:protein-L-isoaspartate(D-aspartate) O-methyltransferase